MNTPKDIPAITALIPCAPLSRPVCSLNEGMAAVYGTNLKNSGALRCLRLPQNQAAAERIFAFIEILKDVMKQRLSGKEETDCEVKPIFTGCSLSSLPGAALM